MLVGWLIDLKPWIGSRAQGSFWFFLFPRFIWWIQIPWRVRVGELGFLPTNVSILEPPVLVSTQSDVSVCRFPWGPRSRRRQTAGEEEGRLEEAEAVNNQSYIKKGLAWAALVSMLPPTGHFLNWLSTVSWAGTGVEWSVASTSLWVARSLTYHILWCFTKSCGGTQMILGSIPGDFRWRHTHVGCALTVNCFSNVLSVLLILERRKYLSGAGRPWHLITFLFNRESIFPPTLFFCYYH